MAKFPLDKHCDMTATKVLTTNHVFEIMLRRGAGESWPDAIEHTLPTRKSAKIIRQGEAEEEQGSALEQTSAVSKPDGDVGASIAGVEDMEERERTGLDTDRKPGRTDDIGQERRPTFSPKPLGYY